MVGDRLDTDIALVKKGRKRHNACVDGVNHPDQDLPGSKSLLISSLFLPLGDFR
jgi:hypothetical protein